MTHLYKFLPATMAATALAALPVAAMANDYTPNADMDTGAEAPAPSGAEMGGMADIQGQISQLETLARIDNVTVIELGDPGAGAPGQPGDVPQDDLGAAPGADTDDAFEDDLAAAPDDDLTAPETEPRAEPGQPDMEAQRPAETPETERGIAPETGAVEPEDPTEPGVTAPEAEPGAEPGAAGVPGELPHDEARLGELHDAIEGNQELADRLSQQNVDIEDVVAIEVLGEGEVLVYVRG